MGVNQIYGCKFRPQIEQVVPEYTRLTLPIEVAALKALYRIRFHLRFAQKTTSLEGETRHSDGGGIEDA